MLTKEKADYLRSLVNSDTHLIDPRAVAKAARNPNCILHDEFEWGDDSRVAEAQRCMRAIDMLRAARMEVDEVDNPTQLHQTLKGVTYALERQTGLLAQPCRQEGSHRTQHGHYRGARPDLHPAR
jgi:Asp-tRNA(Asn)/Glu-tRNA(Gln) amidotransferase A subunit family amidase